MEKMMKVIAEDRDGNVVQTAHLAVIGGGIVVPDLSDDPPPHQTHTGGLHTNDGATDLAKGGAEAI